MWCGKEIRDVESIVVSTYRIKVVKVYTKNESLTAVVDDLIKFK